MTAAKDGLHSPESPPFSETLKIERSIPWYKVWFKAFLQPSADTFRVLLDDPRASIRRVIIWLFIITMIATIGRNPIILLSMFSSTSFLLGTVLIYSAVAAVNVLIFIVVATALHIAAKALGGVGTHSRTCYALGAVFVPFMLLLSLTSGFIVGIIVLLVHTLRTMTIALRSVHEFHFRPLSSGGLAAIAASLIALAFTSVTFYLMLSPNILLLWCLASPGGCELP